LQVSRTLRARLPGNEHFLVLAGGPAPENLTGKLRKFQPDLVLFVDAAPLDQPPGTIEWIPVKAIDGMSASSHSLPLSLLAQYLTLELDCKVAVLGIQPGQNEVGEALRPAVTTAVDEVAREVERMFFAARA
jgi:hydrogenase 3 maturation protease